MRCGSRTVHSDAEVDPDKKPFTIVMPPPNITGQLHMGHALDQTLQDVLTQIQASAGLQCTVAAGKRSRQHRDRGKGSRQDPQGRRSGEGRSGQRGIPQESLGRGRKSSAARSPSSAASWAIPATGAESASPWTRAATRRSITSS